MKLLSIPQLVVLAILSLGLSGVIAQELAVMEIKFGKEKELRRVVIDLYEESAPETVENFKKLARKGFYKNTEFHRAFPGVMVQGGDPLSRKNRDYVGTGGPGYTLPAEIGRRFKSGSIAMGRLGDSVNPARASNGSQFFITLDPDKSLNGQYTVFGEVIEGLDVIDTISRKPTDSNNYPVEKIRIRRIKIEPQAEVVAEAQ